MKVLDKSLIMSDIVVTLTTIPSRLSFDGNEGIKLCIQSLVQQNFNNYQIHLNVPHVHKMTGEVYVIPDWLLNTPQIKIFRTEDFGAATKLLPTVERIQDPETIIIVVDDDLVYHSDMVLSHVENQTIWPEAVVGYDGLRSRSDDGAYSRYFNDSRDYYHTANYRTSLVDILQHYKSVSYKRRYFENDFLDFASKNHSWADDLLLAAYFSYKHRDRIATYHPTFDTLFSSYEEWSTRGGVQSFPVLRHTHHESLEGCNLFRDRKIEDNGSKLYFYIDRGYNYKTLD